jgi:hypothetical protein
VVVCSDGAGADLSDHARHDLGATARAPSGHTRNNPHRSENGVEGDDQPVVAECSATNPLRQTRQKPALIAVFEPTGTAMALQRAAEVVRPDGQSKFS